jgi:hypothetical protein
LQKENAVADAMTRRVAPRNFQRWGRYIRSEDFGMRQLVRQCHCDASGTRTYIRDLEWWTWKAGRHIDLDPVRPEAFKSDFDNMFRFRARD